MIQCRYKFFIFVSVIFSMVLAMVAPLCAFTVHAASPVGAEDGVYFVPVDLSGLAMGAGNFSSASTVEKSGSTYYFTFGHASGIGNMKLALENKRVGSQVRSENGWTYYTYTLNESNIQSSLSFSAHINAMNSDVNFSVKLDLDSATRTGDYDYEGERPAEFVPEITTEAASEYEVTRGSIFSLPAASAKLGEEICPVSVTAYYVQSDGRTTSVTVGQNNTVTLNNVGEYHVVYRAESERYKTSLGGNTYTEYDVLITSKSGAITIAKIQNAPEGASLQAGKISSGYIYEAAGAAMATIADNFEVFGISLVNPDGGATELSQPVTLYLQTNATFDRTKTVVYRMDSDGTLTKLEASGYGRYMKVETDKTGTFIVCVPGVAFAMPMWGYALIAVACVAIVAAAVAVTVIFIRKKKRSEA